MKIVIIGPAYPIRGGNALFIAHLYEALSAANQVEVISFSRLYPGFLFPGVRQIDISGIPMKKHPAVHIIDCLNPLSWRKAARIAASMNPDMLVLNWWNPFFGIIVNKIVTTFKRISKSPVVIIAENVISHEGRWIDIFLTKLALKTADRFLVLSKIVEEGIKRLFPDKKVFRSSLPIYDCYQTKEPLTVPAAKERLGIKNSKVILFFGYIRKYKGLMNIIEAMPSILDQVPEAHLLIVGEFYDDPKIYLDAIRNKNLDKYVTIIDQYVSNETVHQYFTAADLAVLPYNEATQSGILSIAYGFATPVVVTNVGGLAELVDEGRTGFIVPPFDIPKLAEAIIKYFKENLKQEFSGNIALKRKENSFEKINDVFNEIYSDIYTDN